MVATHSVNGITIGTIIIGKKKNHKLLSTMEHKAQKILPNKQCLQTNLKQQYFNLPYLKPVTHY